jgi:hypothetical protein
MLHCSIMEVFHMPRTTEFRQNSPLSILTELAVEGASSFIEAQRIFLNLAQEENELLMNGVKERVGYSTPAVAVTDMMRRSLDTLINMQQEFLTLTSKQTMHWLESVQHGKPYQRAHLIDLAREGMEKFMHAHKKLLDVLTQETIKATSKGEHFVPAKKTDVSQLAREAADLFVEAQKRMLDVFGQQLNTNLNAATQAVETLSPAARLSGITELPAKAVKSFVEGEKALLQSLTELGKKPKVVGISKHPRKHTVKRPA